MADSGQRTEQPTQRRIERARGQGQLPASREFVSAAQFAVAVTLVVVFADSWIRQAAQVSARLLESGFHSDLTAARLTATFRELIVPLLTPLLIGGLLLTTATLGVHLITTGMGFSLDRLAPDFSRLNPLTRLREVPRQNLTQLVHALVLLPVFLFAVVGVVRDQLPAFMALPRMGLQNALSHVASALESLLWKAVLLFLVLGSVDLWRQRRRWLAQLRMSKQEVREEMKEVEGNPQVRARIRRLQRDLLRHQMMNEVPKATAVIVNPTHYAVAIRYELDEMAAPKVVAKGKNYLAGRIRRKAIEHQVPIVENPPLAQALYKSVQVGQEIPVHLYRAVAEVLAYIFRLMNRK